MRGAILQQEAANRDRLRWLNHTTRGITDERLMQICDAERRRIMENKTKQEKLDKTPVKEGEANEIVHTEKNREMPALRK